jgi:hypothetical protein
MLDVQCFINNALLEAASVEEVECGPNTVENEMS